MALLVVVVAACAFAWLSSIVMNWAGNQSAIRSATVAALLLVLFAAFLLLGAMLLSRQFVS